jgi:hypothetical protein
MDLQSVRIDWRQLITQISKPLVQQAASRSRFSTLASPNKYHCFAGYLQGCGMKEIKISADPLQLNGQITLEQI